MISDTEIKEVINCILTEYNPDKIILFGSFANGNSNENSDLDLLIISDKEKNIPRWKRGLNLRFQLSKFIFSKDLLFYTKSEVDRFANIQMSFINTILEKGKVLYERN